MYKVGDRIRLISDGSFNPYTSVGDKGTISEIQYRGKDIFGYQINLDKLSDDSLLFFTENEIRHIAYTKTKLYEVLNEN